MNWPSDNWKFLFAGDGGAAALAFIGNVCKRWFWPQPPEQGANLTAQGASVHDSPVASGSGITQSRDTHNYYYPPAAAGPQPAVESPPPLEPTRQKANVKIVGFKKIAMRMGTDSASYKCEPAHAHGEAVVIDVTNDARQESANVEAVVKAIVIY